MKFLKKQNGYIAPGIMLPIMVMGIILIGPSMYMGYATSNVLERANVASSTQEMYESRAKEQVGLALSDLEMDYQMAWIDDSTIDRSTYFTFDEFSKKLFEGYQVVYPGDKNDNSLYSKNVKFTSKSTFGDVLKKEGSFNFYVIDENDNIYEVELERESKVYSIENVTLVD